MPPATSAHLDVTTPERVKVSLEIAGLGSRALAWLIDAALLFGVTLALYFAYSLVGPTLVEVYQAASTALRVTAAIAGFAVLWVYWTAMEVAWNGQTVGKRLMKIRVVRGDGSPVTVAQSAIRNLLRAVDFLPVCYPVGVTVMLFDAQHRRLGDLAAGTVLIRDQAVDLSRYERAANALSPLSTTDLETVTSLLLRFDALEPSACLALSRKVGQRLGATPDELAALDAAGWRAWLERKVHKGAGG